MRDSKNSEQRINRRHFLKYAALTAGGAVLAGCAPAVPPEPAALAPTLPPQIVEVTKIVAGTPEKEVVVVTATPEPKAQAPASAKMPIIYWSMFGLQEAQQAQMQVDRFNEETGEQAIFMSIGWGNVAQKAQVAIQGGNPPDLVSLWSQAFSWGPRGLLMPLDNYALASKWDGKGWWKGIYESLHSDGHLWGTGHTLNMEAFHMNKDIFEKAGLSTDKPPTDIDTLDTMAEKLTTFDGSGNLTRLGFLPWQETNLWSWGWAFGAKFYDPNTDKILAGTDEKLLAALTWFQSYAKKYDIDKIDRFRSGFTGNKMTVTDPWYVGKLAMEIAGSWARSWIPRYAPDLKWAVSAFPSKPPVPATSLTEIGAMFNIPTGAKNPDGAWKLAMEFASKRCQIEFGNQVGDIPPLQEAAEDPSFISALPYNDVYIKMAKSGGATFPRMPVLDIYQSEIDRATDAVVHGKKTPEQALKDVNDKVQKELDDFRAQTKK